MSESDLSYIAKLLAGVDQPAPPNALTKYLRSDPCAGLDVPSAVSLQWDVFIKAATMTGQPPTVRTDAMGYIIHWQAYGDRNSTFGWEMDHYPTPKSRGGCDELWNLRPLNWLANARHGGLLANR
jgi:hypothetical protein